MTLDKSYDPQQIEQHWYEIWEEKGYFSPAVADENAKPYCIMIPPPNVTGALHMGHAFQDTIMDALTRFHRMTGHKTLWQPGTDHAGIATQMVVERILNTQGKTRHDYGRDQFIKKIWQWREESGGMITHQLRRMGASPDWQNERFTMDSGLSEAVTKVFVELYDQGIIFRGKRLVNWDPVLHTAVSDLEVLSEEEKGFLWHLRYPLSTGNGYVVVATTRPETMLGDSAVAVNPADERYMYLIGQHLDLPLTGRKIPIIADEHADIRLGSGCVKITPAHDFNDYKVWTRHKDNKLIKHQIHGGLINIFTKAADIRQNVNDDEIQEGSLIPERYIGLGREDARKQILADLQQAGLLEKTEEHKLMIPRGDRSGSVIEPYLTDQWYVDLTREQLDDGRPGGKKQITEPAIEAVRLGAVEFVPSNWSKTYYQWLENVEDWCISRQIWWGHRIPAWYDERGDIYVGQNEAVVREKYQLPHNQVLRQDEDVLDTWFSSALWPFSTLGWPQKTQRLETFYPTSVLVTGFDIIFFWVARMIMFGTKFMGQVPFHQVYIHGLIRDSRGKKMSKSKGNVLDPIDLIDGIELEALVEKRIQGMMQPHLQQKIADQTRKDFPEGIPGFGTDALRFTFAALASNGRDINFDLGRIEGYRNFCNKIWNAGRFVLMHTKGESCGQTGEDYALSNADLWIISQLQRSEKVVCDAIKKYRFDLVAHEIYDLVWNKYCDWYLELTKPVLGNDASSEMIKTGTRRTLVHVFETILRLAHPIMPYITEEIWQKVAHLANRKGDTIMTQPYPHSDDSKLNETAEAEIEWVMSFILGLRKIRGEMDISPGKTIPVILENASQSDLFLLEKNRSYLDVIGKVESVTVLAEGEEAPESAMTILGNMKILIPMVGLIDKDQELIRLNKLLQQTEFNASRANEKLSNEKFIRNAPTDVVKKEREKQADFKHKTKNLKAQINKIQAL